MRNDYISAMENEYKLLSEHKGLIYYDRPFSVLIKDPEECDMVYTFKLDKDPNKTVSYTKYNVIDPGHGDIIVYNIDGANNISLATPLESGTYRRKYRLFITFLITVNGKGTYDIEVVFSTKDM